MRLILIILIFFSGTVLSRYHEKTRFDRSIYEDETRNLNKNDEEKQWSFTDYETNFVAYKDKAENNCYLERLTEDYNKNEENVKKNSRIPRHSKVLYTSARSLTKIKAWKIAGGRIFDFCQGRNIFLLQDTKPSLTEMTDPFLNEIPQDENDIVTKTIVDVVLTPLISRAKRQIMLEEREKLNEKTVQVRSRRQVQQPRGRFRGQTQSQYLNIGDTQKEGKAEAEATEQSSRALVSGSNGMGQAQSMSSGGNGCDGCPGYPGFPRGEAIPDRYTKFQPTADTGTLIPTGHMLYPGVDTSGGVKVPPGRVQPGGIAPTSGRITDTKPGGDGYPGTLPGSSRGEVGSYPGTIGTYPGTISGVKEPGGATITGGDVRYPGGVLPGTVTGGVTYTGGLPGSRTTGGVVPGMPAGSPAPYIIDAGIPRWGMIYPAKDMYPGTFTGTGGTYPGGILPSSVTTGGGTTYPGGVAPGSVTTGGGITYPGGVAPGTVTTGGGITYPGGVAPGSVTTGGGRPYPGGAAPGTVTTGGGTTYPGGVAPGSVTTGGGTTYPGGVAPGSVTTGGGTTYPGGVAPGTVTTGGGITYPGGVAPGTVTTGGGTTYPGGVAPGSVTTGGGRTYPGGAAPGTVTTGGGVSYPGGGTMYPGGVAPGTTTTGGGVMYPGNVAPGTSTTGGGVMYPGGVAPGTTTTGGGVMYPGGVAPGTTTTGGGVMYPGGVGPGTTTAGGGVMYPGGVAPGTTTTGGGVMYPGAGPRGTVIQQNGALYADGGRSTGTTGGGALYPGAIVPSITTGTSTPDYPGGIVPAYPGNIISRGDGTYSAGTKEGGIVPGRVVIGSTASADTLIYPGRYPPGIYFDGSKTYQQPGTSGPAGGKLPVLTPSGTATGQVPGVATTGAQDNGAYPGSSQPSQPGTNVPYPSGIAPGTIRTDGTIYQPGTDTGGARQIYPGGIPSGPIIGEGHVLYPGTLPSGSGGGERFPVAGFPGSVKTVTHSSAGQVTYPTGIQPGSGGVQPGPGQLRIPYPAAVDGAGQGVYPGGGVMQYPSGDGRLTSTYPLQPGRYPDAATWQQGQMPGTTGGQIPTATADGQRIGQYGTAQQNVPGGNVFGAQYPDRTMTTGIKESSQYYQQPRGQVPMEDGSDSQASSIVKQIDSGTQASASAQGKFGQGTSQSHVTGTYSGSGSFSAQAGSVDANNGAQTEISGGKEGAKSSAQGFGGYGKSQTQVQLNSESGATSTGAQSSGWNHGTNTQVQASSKGGMADAQANGEGSTSSQAQIGFQPYLKTDEKVERQSRPFRGGGTASAQSGTHRGQSQSQLEGSFQYGITYTGAAQAGSGSGAAASRRPFNFNVTESELFKPFKPYDIPTTTNDSVNDATSTSKEPDFGRIQDEQGLQTSSTSRKSIISNATKDSSDNTANMKNQSVEKSSVDDTVYDVNGDYDEEYTDEDYDSTLTVSSRNSKHSTSHSKEYDNDKDHQSQVTQISSGNQYDIRVNQDSNTARGDDMLQPGQSVEGYTIPSGFRGKVTSVAGSKTVAHGDGKSQSQTVSLIPTELNINHANKSPITETRSLQTNHERFTKQQITSDDKNQSSNFSGSQNHQNVADHSRRPNIPMKPNYYTITNSVAGKLDGSKNSAKKYEHRYYTKSSTCGYFTFSCNIVYGSNGRTKICKPKIPTYPDGTPIKC